MNNKGFTLIELLCTITIMSIIATMACVNLVNIFDTKEKITNANKEEIITEAACTYLELQENKDLKAKCLSNGCQISSTTLINAHLLDNNMISKEVIIDVKMVNQEKKCTIEKEVK